MAHIPIAVLRAVEVRAMGSTWEAAAEAAEWSVRGLRRWIREHEAQWCRVLHKTRRELRDLACDEAVSMLRKHMRDKEAKTSLHAAGSLTSTLSRGGGKRAGATKIEEPSDQLRRLMEAVPEGVTTRLDLHIAASEEEGRQQRLQLMNQESAAGTE